MSRNKQDGMFESIRHQGAIVIVMVPPVFDYSRGEDAFLRLLSD